MTALTAAAIDIGAESGRIAAAHFDGTRISLDVVHRFPSVATEAGGWLRWDVAAMCDEICSGLARLGSTTSIASVGADSFGVDVGLFGQDGALVEQPVTYRDQHRVPVFHDTVAGVGAAALYAATGTQLLEINTLFGLAADARLRPEVLARTDLMVMFPDIIHRLLSGSRVTEQTAATTTGCFDIATGRWATALLDRLGIPTHLLPEVASPGTDLGPITGFAGVPGLSSTRVVLPAAHDTASAVLAIPGADAATLFISSGTWSLAGVVLDRPIISAATQRGNLTNEGGYGGTVRLQRTMTGLWVLQECRRQWAREGIQVSYARLVEMAELETELTAVVNLDAAEFAPPGDMPVRIRDYCRRTGQPVPDSLGAIARVVIDSLALSYRLVLEDLEAVTGVPITEVAVVGGGGANLLLQQSTATATGRPLTCWAREATALGNAAAQFAALGELEGPQQIWDAIAAGSDVRQFSPRAAGSWPEHAERLRLLVHAEQERRGLGDHPTTPA